MGMAAKLRASSPVKKLLRIIESPVAFSMVRALAPPGARE
jgi:hypothetical protein